jgi:phage shock protein C
MSTRARSTQRTHEDERPAGSDLGFGSYDDVTDDDIQDFLEQQEEEPRSTGVVNLPTMAGLATIGVGVAYLLQELGMFTSGFDFSAILGPWLIGALIILVGFGVLSWSPDRQRRRAARRKAAERRRTRQRQPRPVERPRERVAPVGERTTSFAHRKRTFVRSRTNRKLFGVCGGLAEYFAIDPTLVRIAWVIALVASSGTALALYFLLAFVMPDADKVQAQPASERLDDERVIVIR